MSSSTRHRILLTGSSGQVGGALLKTLAPLGELITPTSAQLPLHDADRVRAFVRETAPHWIVNAAAYTAVDQAETDRTMAFAVNADAPRVLGEEAGRLGSTILHFSTDYVFDGTKDSAYVESDATNPLNAYGASKLAGEKALLATDATSLIFRTSWVFGASGKNFLRTILRLAAERDVLNIVGDQHGSPTASRDLAQMLAQVLKRMQQGTSRDFAGIYHAAASGETTWAGFAETIVAESRRRGVAGNTRVIPIPSSAYPTPASRPKNSRLSNEKLYEVFGYRMRDWRETLSEAMQELI